MRKRIPYRLCKRRIIKQGESDKEMWNSDKDVRVELNKEIWGESPLIIRGCEFLQSKSLSSPVPLVKAFFLLFKHKKVVELA